MQVKIDTKEKFHVIAPLSKQMPASMADDVNTTLIQYIDDDIKNIVLDMQHINKIDKEIALQLLRIQHHYYENNASFVTCCLQKSVEEYLAENELLELLNVAPTISEAADILQMEEIERELMDDDVLG